MLFFPLINVKMPTIVGILTFMSRKISCSVESSMKSFITSGPGMPVRSSMLFMQIQILVLLAVVHAKR